jgi:NAD(P)-dependent dehydrogenase (short-subunit alcohol dehydrogenase family)
VQGKTVYEDLFRLDGNVALVTGGSRGIGKAIALGLAQAGADVAVAARSAEALDGTLAEVAGLGRRGLSIPTDVDRVADVTSMVERTVEVFGHIDILVNAAGIPMRKPLVEITEEDFDQVYATNIKGATFACAAAGRHFIQQRSGRVINIASLSTRLGSAGRTLYGGTKAAIGQLTTSLAVEWGPYGICVNAIAPGFIATEFTRTLFAQPDITERLIARTPMGRFGQPEDLVGTAIFLAAPASAFLTGQIIYVDGGYSAG